MRMFKLSITYKFIQKHRSQKLQNAAMLRAFAPYHGLRHISPLHISVKSGLANIIKKNIIFCNMCEFRRWDL